MSHDKNEPPFALGPNVAELNVDHAARYKQAIDLANSVDAIVVTLPSVEADVVGRMRNLFLLNAGQLMGLELRVRELEKKLNDMTLNYEAAVEEAAHLREFT